MLEALISLRVPSDNSMEFYKDYYNTYSLLQMNDMILTYIYDSYDPIKKEFLMRDSLLDGEDFERKRVFYLGAGLNNEALNKRAGEKRGINKKLIDDLYVARQDPVKWYIKSNEYMMLYSYTEQAIKNFLLERNKDPKVIREAQLINEMFNTLKNDSNSQKFITAIKGKSNDVMEEEDELKKVWDYFTRIRNLYMHSGGYITTRFSQDIKNLEQIILKKIDQVDSKLLYDEGAETIFKFLFKEGEIYIIKQEFLNFFRNFTVMILESLDEIYSR